MWRHLGKGWQNCLPPKLATSGDASSESSVGVVYLEGMPRVKKILAWEQGVTAAPLMAAGQGLLFLHVGV